MRWYRPGVVRLVILGGGGFRVPLVHGALLADAAGGAPLVDELVLHDVSSDRLAAIEAICRQQAAASAGSLALRTTTDLADALRGADFVFSAIRVGGLGARAADEAAAMQLGLLGQETTGAAGVLYGLRSVPEAVRIGSLVASSAPDAWVINFTNPAGMVTEAMSRLLGDRVIGICDSPLGLCRRVAQALGVPFEQVWFDYAGLNHLGWLRGAYVDGRDRLPELLASDELIESFEEGRLFGAELLRMLGAIPNEYLYYWYRTDEAIAGLAASPRGAFLAEQQQRFFDAVSRDPAAAFDTWQRFRREREETYLAEARGQEESREEDDLSGGYEGVALRLMRGIASGERATLILNVRNRSALLGLDPDAVVEVPCVVDENGAHPAAVGALAPEQAALVSTVKAVERLTIEAALSGSRARAVKALALHPLVRSVAAAEQLVARWATGAE